MIEKRWLRIIPIALVMYTISYVDRTNVSLSLDTNISSMMKDLFMDDKMKGEAAGIFFFGYVLLQIPGGHLAKHWSARKVVSLCLLIWGLFAVGCGLVENFRQFEMMRFMLGVAESAVFPATAVLLSQWFPKAERARATSYWLLCQPLAVAGAAPITGFLLDRSGWRTTLIIEGALPFIWLPIWWFFIRDHPREAKWISPEERDHLEATLKAEALALEPTKSVASWKRLIEPAVFIMILLYFLHNCAAYGCMTFLSDTLGKKFTGLEKGVLLAIPYIITAIIMVITSRSSDRKGERHGHVAAVYTMSGVCLILSVLLSDHFWISYLFMCFAIPGPFAALAPFWAIPVEVLPASVIGLVIGMVNAFGNVGGFAGPYFVGWLKKSYGNTDIAFGLLGAGMLICAGLVFLLPRPKVKSLPPGMTPLPNRA